MIIKIVLFKTRKKNILIFYYILKKSGRKIEGLFLSLKVLMYNLKSRNHLSEIYKYVNFICYFTFYIIKRVYFYSENLMQL